MVSYFEWSKTQKFDGQLKCKGEKKSNLLSNLELIEKSTKRKNEEVFMNTMTKTSTNNLFLYIQIRYRTVRLICDTFRYTTDEK